MKLKIDDSALEYEISGSGEPVVFIDGALILDTFLPIMAEPAITNQYSFIRYHRQGYEGSSGLSRVVSIPGQASDCAELLIHLGIERAHVVGHSYGGAIALQLASAEPDLVHSLAVLEPALVVGASGDEYRASLALSAERYRKAGAEVTIREFLEARWPGYRGPLEEALPGALTQAVNDAETWFERELPGLLDWRFGREEARRIGQPTLCLLGGRSAEMGARFEEAHELLLDWLPCAEGHIVSYTTHLMQIENPRATAEALASFWSRHPIPTRPGRHAQ